MNKNIDAQNIMDIMGYLVSKNNDGLKNKKLVVHKYYWYDDTTYHYVLGIGDEKFGFYNIYAVNAIGNMRPPPTPWPGDILIRSKNDYPTTSKIILRRLFKYMFSLSCRGCDIVYNSPNGRCIMLKANSTPEEIQVQMDLESIAMQ